MLFMWLPNRTSFPSYTSVFKSQTGFSRWLRGKKKKICLPMQETHIWSLGQEDPLEGEMATHSSIHAWEIPRTEEPGRLQSMGSQKVGHDWATAYAEEPNKANQIRTLLWHLQCFCPHPFLQTDRNLVSLAVAMTLFDLLCWPHVPPKPKKESCLQLGNHKVVANIKHKARLPKGDPTWVL